MTITPSALAEILAHAAACRPRECCGVLVGRSSRIQYSIRTRNLASSPHRFLIDPRDHIAARRAARLAGDDVLGFYHSHPASGAAPSATDLDEAGYPDAVYAIAGIEAAGPVVRMFRLTDGGFDELSYSVELSHTRAGLDLHGD